MSLSGRDWAIFVGVRAIFIFNYNNIIYLYIFCRKISNLFYPYTQIKPPTGCRGSGWPVLESYTGQRAKFSLAKI